VFVCVCACVRACVRACARACVCCCCCVCMCVCLSVSVGVRVVVVVVAVVVVVVVAAAAAGGCVCVCVCFVIVVFTVMVPSPVTWDRGFWNKGPLCWEWTATANSVFKAGCRSVNTSSLYSPIYIYICGLIRLLIVTAPSGDCWLPTLDKRKNLD